MSGAMFPIAVGGAQKLVEVRIGDAVELRVALLAAHTEHVTADVKSSADALPPGVPVEFRASVWGQRIVATTGPDQRQLDQSGANTTLFKQ